MTLFKKVFGSHSVEGMDDPELPTLKDDKDPVDVQDEDFLARLASISGGTTDNFPEIEEPEVQVPDEDEIAETEAAMPDHDMVEAPAPVQEEIEPEPTMAERAAAAQRQIEMSQQRYAVEKEPSIAAPLPAEEDDAEQPAPVAAASEKAPSQSAEQEPAEQAASSAPAAQATQRPGRSARRARTRLLGFGQGDDADNDPIAKAASAGTPPAQTFPVGWFVIVAGPGKGHSFAIFNGASTVGRGEDQAVKLDFGDTSISRQNHAAVAYDDEQNKFYLGHGGKSNIIRLNDRPVLSTEELSHADVVRIGETTLRFVALCGAGFNWGTACNDED